MATAKQKQATNDNSPELSELLGDHSGIEFQQVDKGFNLGFAFDRQLVSIVRRLEGAEFMKDQNAWYVPGEDPAGVLVAVKALRREHEAIQADLDNIKALAEETAIGHQYSNGTSETVKPQVSNYIDNTRNYQGLIINSNSRYVAQLNFFGKDDGAAFVSIHRSANLDRDLMKGEDVSIKYNDKGIAAVTDRTISKSMDVMRTELEESLDKEVDGVTVSVGEKIVVGFAYNTALRARIQQIDGVDFDKDLGAYTAPLERIDNVVRAVSDMRAEFVAGQFEIAELKQAAENKIDNAKVSPAFTKDGQQHSGKIIEIGNRFALQYAGMGNFKLHSIDALDNKGLQKDHEYSIKYQNGRGAVTDLDQKKEANKGVGR
jgi:flagellin-like hook-associated protein FlgL